MKKRIIELLPLGAAIVMLVITSLFWLSAMFCDSLAYPFSFVGYAGSFQQQVLGSGGNGKNLYYEAQILGIPITMGMLLFRRKKYGYGFVTVFVTDLMLALFGFTGAKLLYIIENFWDVIENGIRLRGVSFFGTVLFMPLFIGIWAEVCKSSYKKMMDFITPSIPLMLACIRVGCFTAGCCRGMTYWYLGRPVIVPTQLIESIADLVILYFLCLIERKSNKGLNGRLYSIFLIMYGCIRFLIEILRITPKNLLGMSNGQWLSIVSIFSGIILFLSKKNIANSSGGYIEGTEGMNSD